jgi:ATP-binding cassette subfamily F protein uup
MLEKKYDDKLQEKFHELMEQMEKEDVWSYESEIKGILSVLKINDLNQKVVELSGGMLKKIALAKTVLLPSNLIVLDEPTNHLDIETIIWLEKFLKTSKKAIIMVTHDRYFLDEICDTIYEIDSEQVFQYKGNYSYYLEKRAIRKDAEKKAQKKLGTILRMELAWLRQGPKARSSKSKVRLENVQNLKEKVKVDIEQELTLEVTDRRLGKKILEIENISKSFGDNLIIKNFSYKFKSSEKIGILGANGSGKSTLINLITEQLEVDNGEIIKGLNTKFGLFSQTDENIFNNPEAKIIDILKEDAEIITLKNGNTLTVNEMLEKFLFPKNMHFSEVKNLSGGEKRRLHLLKILMKNPNFLIFDEPTNDLDIQTLSILEDFLSNFTGNLLVVSHDRYFMDRVSDYLFIFEGNGVIRESVETCSEFFLRKSKERKTPKKEKKIRVKEIKEKTKLTFNEKKELEELEIKIEELEIEKEEIEVKFSTNSFDTKELKTINIRYKEIDSILEKKIERWEYLASFED